MAVSKIQLKGAYYAAAWTATATSSNYARLTENLTLPKGVYIIVGKVPIASGNFPGFSVLSNGVNIDDFTIMLCGSQQSAATIINLTEQKTVYLGVAGSASITYSYLERGGLRAIRVA